MAYMLTARGLVRRRMCAECAKACCVLVAVQANLAKPKARRKADQRQESLEKWLGEKAVGEHG
jgi:hypothetical protein